MPVELDQPTASVSPDAAISALLCLFHSYAAQMQEAHSPRLGERIYLHLEGLSQRDDLPDVLHKTCDELSDAWQLHLAGQPGRLA